MVPAELAPKLHEPLREHFAEEPGIEVVVERREAERRTGAERRGESGKPPTTGERRRLRDTAGRRITERRATQVPTKTPELPRQARRQADRILFVERIEPGEATEEDRDAARIVARVQAGDPNAFSVLYTRYFERVFAYMRVALRSREEAEDATQEVFVRAFAALPDFEPRRPFRSWLFTIARNMALNVLRSSGRLELLDPEELERHVEETGLEEIAVPALDWITDRDLTIFVERLPETQRQALFLRYVLDLDATEIANVMGRNVEDIRALQSRAVRFLRDRLAAVGRTSADPSTRRAKMRASIPEATVLRARRFSLH